MEQNYPNPFNSRTNIKYTLANKDVVSLKIFDVLGREVTTLFQGNQEGGTYDFTWNPEALSGGVYFCRLRGMRLVFTRKMLYLK